MTAAAMAAAARAFLDALPERRRDAARYAFDHPARTSWSYLPGDRPGTSLLELDRAARKAAHRLLATALSRPAFAQAATIMAWEEVLDLDEGGRRGRHSAGYNLVLFGSPGAEPWSWRFEGHHLSVTATVVSGQVVVAPLFLGANPARVLDGAGRLVIGPLHREEDVARALVNELTPAQRAAAVVDRTAPPDILTHSSPSVDAPLRPPGVRAAELSGTGRELLDGLVRIHLERLAPPLAEHDYAKVSPERLAFAWAGGLRPGDGHYYRLQLPGLLIEYDNTQDGADHAHTVLRRPGADFAADLLSVHRSAEH